MRATLNDVAGSISGTVTYPVAPDEEGEYADIDAELKDSNVPFEEFETATASTVANADGTYTLYLLSPASYDVAATATVDATEYSDGPTTVPVAEGEDVMGVDFSLQ